MELIVCAETSVRNYSYSLRNDPEERSSFLVSRRLLDLTADSMK